MGVYVCSTPSEHVLVGEYEQLWYGIRVVCGQGFGLEGPLCECQSDRRNNIVDFLIVI
jgi:hypothetical protein